MTAHTEKLYGKYLRECERVSVPGMSREEFDAAIQVRLADMETLWTDGGAVYYRLWEEGGQRHCAVPVYGYWAASEKALSRLFTALAEKTAQKTTVYHICLYAHDTEAQRLFSMLQFGTVAEKGIMRIGDAPPGGPFAVKTLSKSEIAEDWNGLWDMTHAIVRHLQLSPVFYPGREFTEDVYREFYLDEDTHLHAVCTPEGERIGLIESNEEGCWFTGSATAANVGEAYVLPPYRGSGAAQSLLSYAAAWEKERGAEYLWVEHGTANPLARGFWGKYLKTFQYEMTREICVEIE